MRFAVSRQASSLTHGRTGSLDTRISPPGLGRDLPFTAVGPALTVENRAGDLLATVAAVRFLKPGDILVASVGGYSGCAAAGDLVKGTTRNAGAAGFVTDGPLRDYTALVEVGPPLWCAGLNPASPSGNGPGRIGLAIMIGGRQVETGDIVVADRDGVVVVPFVRIDVVLADLEAVKQLEAAAEASVADGAIMLPSIGEILESDRTVHVE
jgi:4-hydroxy-4-methyl-2-oxoglutarate aldolase